MTTINLDAATLAKVQSVTGPVTFCDENGNPVVQRIILATLPLDREPDLTDEEWDALANDPVDYSLDEAWEKIRRGETL